MDYINFNNYNLNKMINIRANIGTYRMFIIKELAKKIKVIFGDINKVFMIKILLLIIKQKKLIKEYTVFFRQ